MKRRGIKLKTRVLISIILGGVGFILTFGDGWDSIKWDSYEKIKAVETAIEREFKKEPEPDWSTIEEITGSLCWENQKIAKAKALSRYKEEPINIVEVWYRSSWDNRFEDSKKHWRTLPFKILTCFGVATLVFVVLAILTFLLLTIISWLIPRLSQLWDFLLDEISEMSQAIQGKRDRCPGSKKEEEDPGKGKIEDDTLQSKAQEIEQENQ